MINVVLDRLFQLLHAAEDTVANAVAGNVTKPAFDDIQPRTAGRDKVNVETFVTLQPVLNFRMLVCCIVVDDQMQIESWRRFRIDLLEEPNPFLAPMTGHVFGYDFSLNQFDGSKEGGGAIAFVVVCLCLQSFREKRKTLLCPVECMDLALLVTGKYQSMFSWLEVKLTTSTSFSANLGSFETLNVPVRCGFSPLSDQTR